MFVKKNAIVPLSEKKGRVCPFLNLRQENTIVATSYI